MMVYKHLMCDTLQRHGFGCAAVGIRRYNQTHEGSRQKSEVRSQRSEVRRKTECWLSAGAMNERGGTKGRNKGEEQRGGTEGSLFNDEEEECCIWEENYVQITLFISKICIFDILFVSLRAFC